MKRIIERTIWEPSYDSSGNSASPRTVGPKTRGFGKRHTEAYAPPLGDGGLPNTTKFSET